MLLQRGTKPMLRLSKNPMSLALEVSCIPLVFHDANVTAEGSVGCCRAPDRDGATATPAETRLLLLSPRRT
jgi:hypothetical protein